MTTMQKSQLPTAETLQTRVRDALAAVGSDVDLGEPGGHGLQASTPITGDVLFTIAETSLGQADAVDNSVYSLDWLAGQIGHHIHDPYELYEKAASQ